MSNTIRKSIALFPLIVNLYIKVNGKKLSYMCEGDKVLWYTSIILSLGDSNPRKT